MYISANEVKDTHSYTDGGTAGPSTAGLKAG